MRDQETELRTRGVEVLGISFDTVEENRAFAEKFGFPYRLLCDTERRVGVAYGAADDATAGYAKRISYVIGEDGNILLAYPKVKPDEHLEKVLADLDALG
ncbi:MAG: redoxin domain-containing protein [Deltaproteobacteria bacterium]|nr:MAG: redoxin domain-containing protein [Deltaproteobacteria bacterium]